MCLCSSQNVYFIMQLHLLNSHSCIFHCTVASALASINSSAAEEGAEQTLLALQNECVEVGRVDPASAERYHAALGEARRNKGEDLTAEEIRRVVEEVNEVVRLEGLSK